MLPTLSSVSTTLNSNLLTSGPVQIKSKMFDIVDLYSTSFQTNSRGWTEFSNTATELPHPQYTLKNSVRIKYQKRNNQKLERDIWFFPLLGNCKLE